MKKSTSFKAMLATISLLGIVPVTVNTFMNQSVVPFARTSLEDVITERTVPGAEARDPDSLLAQILLLNPGLVINDVVVSFFNQATEISSGAATISAKEGTNYIGSVGITIDRLPKIELSSVITATQVKGENALDSDALLKEIGLINPRLTVSDVEIKDFIKATEISDGSAKIAAQEGTKYTGEVEILLTALPKQELSDVVRIREVPGGEANTEEAVLDKVKELNPELEIADVIIEEFKAASEAAPGWAKIVAKENTRYNGEVTIVITPIPKIELRTVITERTVSGVDANTAETVLAKIAELNPDLVLGDVQVKAFNTATDITPGSAIIAATVNGKYTGQVGITITPLTDAFLQSHANDEEDVNNAIHSTKFSKSISVNSKANEVISSIDSKYIKDRLSDEIGFVFNDNLFKVNSIVKLSGDNLTDQDLIAAQEIQAEINYDYGSFENQVADVVLTVKQIEITNDRDELLKQIKNKADNNEDDDAWSTAWFNYFKQIEKDLEIFSFQFPSEVLNQNKIAQTIIYDEIKLVMEADFKFWSIEKGYDPDSVEVQYTKFDLTWEQDEYKFFAEGRVSIDIRAYGQFVKHSVRFNYNSNYTVV